MFDGGAGIQGQGDVVIRSGNRLRDIAGFTLLWIMVFSLGFSCGFLRWVGPSGQDIRDIVAAEVPAQVRLILNP